MPKQKTNPETVVEKLTDRINSIYDKFKTKKRDLVEQFVTIKERFAPESSEIDSETLSETESVFVSEQEKNAPEDEIESGYDDFYINRNGDTVFYNFDDEGEVGEVVRVERNDGFER